MRKIYTTAGAFAAEDFKLALPHEHIFTETGDAPAWTYRDADAGDVLRKNGITTLCSAVFLLTLYVFRAVQFLTLPVANGEALCSTCHNARRPEKEGINGNLLLWYKL